MDPNRPYVLFVGRITRQKGISQLIQAIPQIDKNAQVVLCAGAPDTIELADECKALIEDVQKTRDAVTAAISRDVSLDLPKLQDYAGKTNEAMIESLNAAGYSLYDNTNDEDRNVDGFDMFKIASDIDPEKASNAYSQGLENLKPVDTARYLKGSWRFLVSRANGAEIRLRYADFDSADAIAAIHAAIQAQGFEDANLSDAAEDTMGNTNLSGKFKKDKVEYAYTISSCDLSQVYDIEGLPENAQYVGIRVTEAATV